MNFKAHALNSLNTARRMTETVLEQFKNDDDFFYQTHPNANHALWVIGHLALADNMFASKFRPETENKPDGWDDLFWFGSQIKDKAEYPSPREVLVYMKERRENLLNVIEQLSDEELAAAAPSPEERSPIAGAPNIGQLFLFAAYHEGIHFGQLTVCHRGLGNQPVYQPQPAAAS